MRWFLHSYFGGVSGQSYSLRLRDMPGNDHCPSICYTADFFDLFDGKPGPPQHIFAEQLLQKPLILLLRDPRDVIVSYFHFTQRLSPDRFRAAVPSGLLVDFVKSDIFGIERISRYHLMEQQLFALHSGPKLLLNYEHLWNNPDEGFRPLVEFLRKSEFSDRHYSTALHEASFSVMQELEIEISRTGRVKEFMRLGVTNWNSDLNALKVRKGGIGGFMDSIPELADQKYLEKYYSITLKVLLS